MTLQGIGHESFSAKKARDPASCRRTPAFDSRKNTNYFWCFFYHKFCYAKFVTQRGVYWNHLRTDMEKIKELIDAIEKETNDDDCETLI